MNSNEKIIERLEREKKIIEEGISRLNNGDEMNTDEFRSLLNNMYNKHLLLITLEELAKINDKLDGINTTPICRFSDENTNNMMKMIVSTQATGKKGNIRNSGMDELRKFTRDAKDLVVIDPYFFKAKMSVFANASNLNKGQISSLHIIYDENVYKYESEEKKQEIQENKKELAKICKGLDCNLTVKDTNLIHDRIWIKDDKFAKVIGSSLNGLGNKLCFILDLPPEDLSELKDFLTNNRLTKIAVELYR